MTWSKRVEQPLVEPFSNAYTNRMYQDHSNSATSFSNFQFIIGIREGEFFKCCLVLLDIFAAFSSDPLPNLGKSWLWLDQFLGQSKRRLLRLTIFRKHTGFEFWCRTSRRVIIFGSQTRCWRPCYPKRILWLPQWNWLGNSLSQESVNSPHQGRPKNQRPLGKS